jgi:hypothetical protein
MSDSALVKVEGFLVSPWSVTALALILGGVGMKYQEQGNILLLLGALFGVVAVLRHCQSLKMTFLQIAGLVALTISAILVFFSFTIWAPKESSQPSVVKKTASKLPGLSVQIFFRLNYLKADRRKYLFDFGKIDHERLSIYVSRDDVFTFSFTDAKGEPHLVQIPIGDNGIPLVS